MANTGSSILRDRNAVARALAEASSMTDALRRLGLHAGGGNHRALRNACSRLGLAEIVRRPQAFGPPTGRVYANEQVFVRGSTYTNRAEIKRRMVNELGVPNECAVCHNPGIWLGRPLSLQLDHINGISDDNRQDNLRLLCPNCHAQTETFTGRRQRRPCPTGCGTSVVLNARRCRGCRTWLDRPRESGRRFPTRYGVEWPSLEDLATEVADTSLRAVGRRLGVSDNAVRKHLGVIGMDLAQLRRREAKRLVLTQMSL